MENDILQQSHAYFGERVEKTDENRFGWQRVTDINPQDTVCLVLGGQSTTEDRTVNSYCSALDKLLKKHNLRDSVRIIGVINDYGDDFDPSLARTELMNEHNRGEKVEETFNAEIRDPQYIEDIYKTIIEPRLVNEGTNQRLPLDEACRRMRKLNIYAHCHGGYTAMKLEQLTLQKMAELGYSENEAAQIQKNLLVVAYAPYCPLGRSKSTMISFASGEDRVVRHNNVFENTMRYLKDVQKEKFSLSFFANQKGNLFYTPTLGPLKPEDQHEFIGFEPDKEIPLNGDGRQLMKMLRNTLLSGIKSSLSDQPLGEVKELVATGYIDREFFDVLQQNGEKMWVRIRDYASENLEAIQAYAAQEHIPEQKEAAQQNPPLPVSEGQLPEIFSRFRKKVDSWFEKIIELKESKTSSEATLGRDLSPKKPLYSTHGMTYLK